MWTSDSEQQLRELWAQGKPASVCAALLHTTRNAVIGKVSRLQLPQRPTDRPRLPPRPRKRKSKVASEAFNQPKVRRQVAPALTKNELRAMFADAWRNTSKLP